MPQIESHGNWFAAIDSPNVLGQFEERPVLDEKASLDAGDYQYKKIIGIHMRVKNSDSGDVSWQRLWPHNAKQLIERFPRAWEHFQTSRADMGGQRIANTDWIPERFKVECYGLNAETVEQLAALPDELVKPIMGLIRYRDMARAEMTDAPTEQPSAITNERERLLAMAGTIGLAVDGRWSNETLLEKIEEARVIGEAETPPPPMEGDNGSEDNSDQRA